MQPSVRINLLFQPRRWSIFVFFFTGDILCKASQVSESQVRPVSVHSSATYQNRYLAGFVIKSLQLDDWLQCLMTCESFPECISYNFNPRLRRCDINSRGITGSQDQECLGEESLIFSQDSVFQQIKVFRCNSKLTSNLSDTTDNSSYWSPWQPWSSCSTSCIGGVKRRMRLRLTSDGSGCSGSETMTRECSNPVCFDPSKFCLDKSDGDYGDPTNSHRFISCTGGKLLFRACQNGLVYNFSTKQCDW